VREIWAIISSTEKTTRCVIRSLSGRGLWLGGQSNHSINRSANQSNPKRTKIDWSHIREGLNHNVQGDHDRDSISVSDVVCFLPKQDNEDHFYVTILHIHLSAHCCC
jgi:hypothetical protein